MGSDRDHEENASFRDRSQEEGASMSDMGTVAKGIPSAQHSWEEWLEKTSAEQILILSENNRKKALRTRRKRHLLRACRFVLPIAAAAMVIFLCAIPTGQALANAALQNITELIDRYFYVTSANVGNTLIGTEATAGSSVVLNGLDKITAASRKVQKPLLYIGRAGLIVSDVAVEMNDATTEVRIEYRTSERDKIVTRQRLSKDKANWGATMDVDGTAPLSRELFNGETLYYTYTKEGYAYGGALWGNTAFFISSPTLKWEKLLESVDALAYAEDR